MTTSSHHNAIINVCKYPRNSKCSQAYNPTSMGASEEPLSESPPWEKLVSWEPLLLWANWTRCIGKMCGTPRSMSCASSGAGPSGTQLVRRLGGVHDVWDYSLGNPRQAIRWGSEGRMQHGDSVRDSSQDYEVKYFGRFQVWYLQWQHAWMQGD